MSCVPFPHTRLRHVVVVSRVMWSPSWGGLRCPRQDWVFCVSVSLWGFGCFCWLPLRGLPWALPLRVKLALSTPFPWAFFPLACFEPPSHLATPPVSQAPLLTWLRRVVAAEPRRCPPHPPKRPHPSALCLGPRLVAAAAGTMSTPSLRPPPSVAPL